jgi:membrane protein implicated in regulation of membrane protease activity
VGALVVCGVQWMAGDWSFNRDLLIFAVSATVAFAGFRRFFHRARDQQLAHDDVNQY